MRVQRQVRNLLKTRPCVHSDPLSLRRNGLSAEQQWVAGGDVTSGVKVMRCYFLRGGQIPGVNMLPRGLSDQDALGRAETQSLKRRGSIDGLEVWDRARLIFRRLGPAGPANPSSGILAEAGRDRPLRLLRSPYECPGALRVPALRDRPLATNASAAQPEGRLHVGPYDAIGRRLAPRAAHPSSLARPALRRQTPEVGAGCSNWARPDLCGGRSAMSIPTAILGQYWS
jgi:hypothetical protein